MPRSGGGGDKKARFFEAIVSQKLEAVRWGVANAGVAPATRDPEGHTIFMIAALHGKDRSLAELVRFYERRAGQLRECLVQVDDDTGRTCMHMACAHPQGAKCVAELLDAWQRVDAKRRDAGLSAPHDADGKTPRDLARAAKTVELIADWLAEDEEDDEEDDETDDGLTSTQRSKLKKRALAAHERRGAPPDSSSASKPTAPDDDGAAGDDDTTTGSSSRRDAASAEDAGASPNVDVSNKMSDPDPPLPAPTWPEIEAWAESVEHLRPICEMSVVRDPTTQPLAPFAPPAGDGGPVDPALYGCASLNRLRLALGPSLERLDERLGRLTNLATLIVAGNGLVELPACLGALPLKSLDASRNRLSRLPAVMPAKTLEALDVSGNELEDLAPLAPCVQLVSLALDANPKLADLSPLRFAELKRMTTLSACGCAVETLDPAIGGLSKLETLALSHNPLTKLPPTLAACKKLKELKVDNTRVADNKVLGYIDRGEMKQLAKYWEKTAGGSSKGGGSGKKGKR